MSKPTKKQFLDSPPAPKAKSISEIIDNLPTSLDEEEKLYCEFRRRLLLDTMPDEIKNNLYIMLH